MCGVNRALELEDLHANFARIHSEEFAKVRVLPSLCLSVSPLLII